MYQKLPGEIDRLQNEQAEITEKECILCGHCFLVCPQMRKYINSSIEKVKGYLKNGDKVYVSVAPSFASCYKDATFRKISSALKKLGFAGVEETSIGAAEVSRNFGELMKEHKMKNIITTCCPTIVLLVEKYYPGLCHTLRRWMRYDGAWQDDEKGLREPYQNGFVGPCISKSMEAQDEAGGGAVDAVCFLTG